MVGDRSAGSGSAALAGLVVLELGEDVAAPFAGQLLAIYGARVIKVEPPGGDPVRALGPFPDTGAGPELGALYLYLNAGKESVVLDLDTRQGQEQALRLAASADIVLENLPFGYLEQRGLGGAALLAANPRLVCVSLSAFGRSGPRAAWKATNLTSMAAGGQMQVCGDPEREPLKPGGEQADYQLGLNGFGAALAGYWQVLESGRGDLVEVSAQEVMASTLEGMLCGYAYAGRRTWVGRRGNVTSSIMGVYPCADGFLGIHAMPRNIPPFFRLMGHEELLQDARFNTSAARLENDDVLRAEVYAWAAESFKHEVYQRAGSMRGPVAFVHDMADLFESPQLQARCFLRAVEHPLAGSLIYPGPPFLMSASPGSIARAPLLGEHTETALAEPRGAEPRDAAEQELAERNRSTPAPVRRLPLAGVRIVDLTAVWAGPYATRLLADMGAEVIKVESGTSPDLLRALSGKPLGTPRSYNLSAYFNHNNRNKYGCSIDLATEAGRELFLELVAVADVVIENFRADVLDHLQIGYEVLRAARPDIVLVSMPGHGKTGPESGFIAYGTNMEQLAGLVSITGYEGGDPHKSAISYGDPIAGTAAAGAVLTALLYRRRTGLGQHVDLAQREALTGLLGEYLLQYGRTRVIPERTGNTHPVWAPHGVYPCEGDDAWVAIAVTNDEEFSALAGAIGRAELAEDERFAGAAGRRLNRKALDGILSEWTAGRSPDEAALALQAAGVPAAPVESYVDLLDADEHLRSRGYFEEVTHAEAGTWRMERPVWRFAAAPAHVRLNAPSFAEHNGWAFGDLLGADAERLRKLTSSGVTAEEPDLAVHRT